MNKIISEKVYQLKVNEKIPLTNDIAFKIMFANEKRIEPLALLLSRIFEERYDDMLKRIMILTTYVPNDHLIEKKTERDVVVKLIHSNNKNEIKILIEVNMSHIKHQLNIERNLLFLTERFSEGLKEDKSYKEIKKTVLVNLSSYSVDKESKDLIILKNVINSGMIIMYRDLIMNIKKICFIYVVLFVLLTKMNLIN